MANLNISALKSFVQKLWDESAVPTLEKYIEIPNVSPLYDANWATNGLQEKALELISNWIDSQPVKGLKKEVITEKGRTPLIYLEIAPTEKSDEAHTILCYAHLDKQPPMTGWDEGLDPYKPVIRNGKLYGRGGADDGYGVFAAVSAIRALQDQGVPHARICVILEFCEESGSADLPHYVDKLASRLGTPELVVCLDSGSVDYEAFTLTTSLRGTMGGDLKVQILKEGIHSGASSGFVPDSFRIARHVLSRVEDPATGKILIPELYGEIPKAREEQMAHLAKVLDYKKLHATFPLVEGASLADDDAQRLICAGTWMPTLTVTGADGLPPLSSAGNVLRPHTALKLSVRLPPSADADKAAKALQEALERDPPYGAKVTFKSEKACDGWDAPALAPWLKSSLEKRGPEITGKPCNFKGEGGSIPFMGMLGEKFPEAQFCVAGVLGPNSNAHGPNEFLHIAHAQRVAGVVAGLLADHKVWASKK